ncbi:alkaline phosphatase family protein [Muriicola sp. Z0-33]|uniref:alkaline phosphatase family protein n=1 Tax=Muriicola sp. Z0-33 TaxID=2816957 RepID=UPI002237768E|nr:alkaline phosphatase family protein [Muriicola sp. Z0-33]MCW5517143.1 alkaline phosphatase family protein [Muriicola sp. Z0-33]
MRPITFLLLAFLLLINVPAALAQENTSPKIVLITLDGLRWQELFSGADPLLVANEKYVKDTVGLKKNFWRNSAKERRQALLPFLWTEVPNMGQLHGNRNLGSKVNLTNTLWFSYPGYNEILSGTADDQRITSNDKLPNPNRTILEIANKDARFKGKVAAFGSWDVFPFIINEERSGVPVNAGFEIATSSNLSPREVFLNELQPQVPSPWSTVRLDAFTHHYAKEFMQKNHPDFIYIAYGETDDFAHEGHYDAYLKAARNTDGLIKDLWEFTKQDDYYKVNTLFIITTDHGRGTDPLENWQHHGNKVVDAGQVWFLCFGNEVAPLGEVNSKEQLYSNQIAPTILNLLGLQDDLDAEPIAILKK